MNDKQQKLIEQMRLLVAAQTLQTIVSGFEATEKEQGDHIPHVRGVLMDEMERRAPIAFTAWLECADPQLAGKPSHFIQEGAK